MFIYLWAAGSAAFFRRPVWEQTIGKQSRRETVPKESGGAGCFGQNLPQIGKVFHQLAPALARIPLRGNANTRHPSHSHYRSALATANLQHSASFALKIRFRSRSSLTLRHREAFRSKRGLSFRVYATLRPIAVAGDCKMTVGGVFVGPSGPQKHHATDLAYRLLRR